ncbi:MAG: hypothetical protein EOP34_10660 [Rickettsiales bacterium]|nr:MAG: hypothetical protein EOP34_10660 [Rickettsiales bacterium]
MTNSVTFILSILPATYIFFRINLVVALYIFRVRLNQFLKIADCSKKLACLYNNISLAKILIKKGAVINSVNNNTLLYA